MSDIGEAIIYAYSMMKRVETPLYIMKELDTKYYVPDVSDLFIGYEFEQDSEGRPGYPDWLPNCKVDDGDDLEYIRTGEWKIRTPYLTKEQIEKEGWRYNKYSSNFGDFENFLKKGLVDGVEYELELTFKNEIVTIGYDCGEFYNSNIFVGKCPSINEFRKICKLLGI